MGNESDEVVVACIVLGVNETPRSGILLAQARREKRRRRGRIGSRLVQPLMEQFGMDAWKKLAAAAMVVILGSTFQGEAVAGGSARVNAAGRPVGLGAQAMGGQSNAGTMQNPARLVANRARNGLSKGTTGQYKAKTHAQHQVLSPNKAGGQRKNTDNRH